MCRETILRYSSPAENFNEALPIGNGRIGAMIYGDTAYEKIPLNEDSVWSGGLRHRVNPDAAEGLAEVRSLIKKGDIPQAERIAFEKLQGVTPNMRRYMPLGDLHIDMELGGRARNYSRKLDIGNAVSEVTFTVNDILFRKEYFISAPDEVMAVRISSAERGMINLSAYIDGREDYYDDNRPCGKNMLLFTGGSGSKDGIFFAAVLSAKARGGSIRTLGGRIAVKDADEVMLLFSVRTSFYGDNYEKSAIVDAELALKSEYDELKNHHINDYKDMFDRVEFSLCDNTEENLDKLDTAERIKRLKGDELDNKDCERLIHDNKLIELYFNFGRYLMPSRNSADEPARHME